MSSAKRQYKLAIVNAECELGTVAGGRLEHDFAGRERLLEPSIGVAKRRDSRNGAERRDDATAEYRAARQARSRRADRRGRKYRRKSRISKTMCFPRCKPCRSYRTQLKGLIVTNAGDPIWMANLVPTTSVSELPPAPTLNEIVSAALKNRPEIQQAADKYGAANIDVAFAKDQALPQADVLVTYQSNGFAGLLQPTPNAVVQGCPFRKRKTVRRRLRIRRARWRRHTTICGTFKYPTFNIGVTVSYPVGNHLANGLRGVASEESSRPRSTRRALAARIGYDARNALQSYQSAFSRLHAARIAREAAEQVYASEVRKYHNGASTTFLAAGTTGRAKAKSRSRASGANGLNKANVELQRIQGNDTDAKQRQSANARLASARTIPSAAADAQPVRPCPARVVTCGSPSR